MKNLSLVLVIITQLIVFSACSVNNKHEQMTDFSQLSSDISIENVFPNQKGYIWYYEGPNDSEKVSMIDTVSIEEDKCILGIKSCREDLSGTEKLEDRISYETIEITDNQIIHNGAIILKAPIQSGNTWETYYQVKPSGEKYEAKVEIIEVKNGNIKTKTIVDTKNNDIKESYEELTEYKLKVGIISQWYSIIGIDNYSYGLELQKVYEQPEIPEKWYLPPYAIEIEKSKLNL